MNLRRVFNLRLFRRLARYSPGLRDTTGLSMLIVEQNLDLVLDVADRIVALERGRIVREMAASEVRAGAMAELLGMGCSADHSQSGWSGARCGGRQTRGLQAHTNSCAKFHTKVDTKADTCAHARF